MLDNSLIAGFLKSNLIGQGIVIVQIVLSVMLVAIVIRKKSALALANFHLRRYKNDLSSRGETMARYFEYSKSDGTGAGQIYYATCERLMKILSPEERIRLAGRKRDDESAALSDQEIALVDAACDCALESEMANIRRGTGFLSDIVMLTPMLGLLGTVWGVLDAFYEMGTAGSANLATIAPSISSALVTTVAGLLVAIPGTMFSTNINAGIEAYCSALESFADELINRIACEFQNTSGRA